MTTKKKTAISIVVIICMIISLAVPLAYFISRGQKAIIAEAFVKEMSDDITTQTLDSLQNEMSTEMVEQLINQILTEEKMNQLVTDSMSKQLKEGDSNELTVILKEYIKEQVKRYTSVFTKEQTEAIQNMIQDTLYLELNNLEVNNISDALMAKIEANIRKSFTGELKQYIDDSIATMDLTTLKERLNIEAVVNQVISDQKIIDQSDITALKETILQELEKSTETPKKGIDYFTEEDIRSIEEGAADIAVNQINSALTVIKEDVSTLKSNVSSIESSINSLNSQLTALKGTGSETFSLADAQNSITTINTSITEINSTVETIGNAINVHNSWLHRVTAKNGTIDSVENVDTSNMTIAEFVGILSGNQKEYTTAIQQLNIMLLDLEKELADTNATFSQQIATVNQSITDLSNHVDASDEKLQAEITKNVAALGQQITETADNLNQTISDTKTELSSDISAISGRLQESMINLNDTITGNQDAVNQMFEDYKEAYEKYTNDRTEANAKALEDAKAALEQSLTDYADNLKELDGVVSELDVDTQTKIVKITGSIQGVMNSLDQSNADLTAVISSLSNSSTEAQKSLEVAIEEVSTRLEESLQDIDSTMKSDKQELTDSISNVNDRLAAADTWATNITLSLETGSNTASMICRESDVSNGYVWKIYGTDFGLNLTETSDVMISWNINTPDISPKYTLLDGELDIRIETDEVTLLTSDLVLDVVHVETR